jgi:Tfp pilus assembly protein PilN
MRPVNLIPPDERRGDQAPLRSGPLAYVLVAALALVLIGVTSLVLTNNEISENKSEIAKLQEEDAVAGARADRLAAYTQFALLRERRVETVQRLADSRFDWERVMRELSLVLPSDVWLISLKATASPEVTIESSGGGAGGGETLRSAAPGPAMVLAGCTTGQEAVAGFVSALEDIDGVTRVGVESSELSEQESAGGAGDAGGSSDSDCRTRSFIAKFEIVVAFDAAPVAQVASSAEGLATATETAESTEEGEEGEGEEG